MSDEIKQYKSIEIEIYKNKSMSLTKLMDRYIMVLAYIETQGLNDHFMDFVAKIESEIQKEIDENGKL